MFLNKERKNNNSKTTFSTLRPIPLNNVFMTLTISLHNFFFREAFCHEKWNLIIFTTLLNVYYSWRNSFGYRYRTFPFKTWCWWNWRNNLQKKILYFVVTFKQDKVEAEIHGNQSNGSKCIWKNFFHFLFLFIFLQFSLTRISMNKWVGILLDLVNISALQSSADLSCFLISILYISSLLSITFFFLRLFLLL